MTAYVVSSGVTSSGITLNSSDTEIVLSGGRATSNTISSGGSETLAGGFGSSATIDIGGSLTVSLGGQTSFDTIDSGGLLTVSSGGQAAGEVISGGSLIELSGGIAGLDIILGGGTMSVAGSANNDRISSDGSLIVVSGGTAFLDTIDSGGSLTVSSGGQAEFSAISSGGSESVSSGGSVTSTTIGGGGSLIVSSGGSAGTTTISSGGSLTVVSGGFGSSTTIDSGGLLTVSSGGQAEFTAISSGGSESVSSGGSVTSTTISSGGSLIVSSGGSAGTTTISSGGSETVLSGGIAIAGSGVVLDSGAVLDLLSGAIVSGGIVFSGSGGELRIQSSTAPSNTISGFTQSGDVIDLTGLTFSGNTSVAFNSSTDVLTVTEGGNSATIQLDSETYTGITWSATQDAGTGTEITAACFCRGTLIWTELGEVAVEDLAIGDEVVILSGEARPIKWIGRRTYDGRFVTANRAVLPIRIEAGALDDGVPTRELLVSPQHALYINDVLVPAALLVNGATIRQVERIDRLAYFHIELAMHEVILAEGAPAESFVDCDNRGMFQNGAEFAALYPDDTPAPWEFCAPRLDEASAELPAIRAALLERAEAQGDRLTDDADLHLIVDGQMVRAQAIDEDFYGFTIPAGGGAIWLASRSAVPAEVEACSRDRRRLGVPLKRIVLREADLFTDIGHGHASLRKGFHDDESGCRWTDGMARLPDELLRPFAGDVTVEVHLIKPSFLYPLKAPAPAAAPARIRRRRTARR